MADVRLTVGACDSRDRQAWARLRSRCAQEPSCFSSDGSMAAVLLEHQHALGGARQWGSRRQPADPRTDDEGVPPGWCLPLLRVGGFRHGLASGTNSLTTAAMTSSLCPTQVCPPSSNPMNFAPAIPFAVYCALA